MKRVADIVNLIPQSLNDCSAIQGEFARIQKWGEIFADPVKLVQVVSENFFKNYVQIMEDVSKTSTDFADNDFYNAGEEVADMLILTVGPVPTAEEMGLY